MAFPETFQIINKGGTPLSVENHPISPIDILRAGIPSMVDELGD